jgi:hypothetical protein
MRNALRLALPAHAVANGAVPSAFTMNSGHFPGTLAMIRQTVTSVADSTAISIVLWISPDAGGDGSIRRILHVGTSSSAERGYVRLNSDNTLGFRVNNGAGTALVNKNSAHTLLAGSGWTCVMCSADLVANRALIYFGDVEEYNGTCNSTATNFQFDATGLYRWSIGGTYTVTNPYAGGLGNLAFHHSVALDFTQEAVRRKFLDGNGKPVDLGSDGSTPFGSQPLIYMGNPGTDSDWDAGTNLNRGLLDSGAAWSKAGTGNITSATPP